MTKNEARAIYQKGEEAVVLKLLEYDHRLKKLENMLGLNSKNSSKPPSTDSLFDKENKENDDTENEEENTPPNNKKKSNRGGKTVIREIT